MMKNRSGFSILASMILLGSLSAISMYLINGNSELFKLSSKIENKFTEYSLDSIISSRVSYSGSCKVSTLPFLKLNSNGANMITNHGGPIEVVLFDDSLAKNGSRLDKYQVEINSLNITDFNQVGPSYYGYKFYSGNLKIQNNLLKTSIKGQRQVAEKVVSAFSILVDPTNEIIACSSSIDDLKDQIITKIIPPSEPNLPPLEVPIGCDTRCIVEDFFARNPGLPGWSNDARGNADSFISASLAKGIGVDQLASSYSQVEHILLNASGGNTNNAQSSVEVLDNWIKNQNYDNAQSVQNITTSLSYYNDAVNSGNNLAATILANAASQGYGATTIVDNYNTVMSQVISHGYTADQVSSYFSSGGTFEQAYAMGYLP